MDPEPESEDWARDSVPNAVTHFPLNNCIQNQYTRHTTSDYRQVCLMFSFLQFPVVEQLEDGFRLSQRRKVYCRMYRGSCCGYLVVRGTI